MNWISCEDAYPKRYWDVVWVTDGKLTTLAHWIENPIEHYGPEMIAYDYDEEVKLGDEWKEPHWEFILAESRIGPFNGPDECFGEIGDISHWMPIPTAEGLKP